MYLVMLSKMTDPPRLANTTCGSVRLVIIFSIVNKALLLLLLLLLLTYSNFNVLGTYQRKILYDTEIFNAKDEISVLLDLHYV